MKYNFDKFNLFGQVKKELADFFDNHINIGGTGFKKGKGYKYNQFNTLQLIEFVGASKFEKGDRDSEGAEKIYLNNSTFRADVSSKQIDIDVKNFVFIPDEFSADVACSIYKRKFKRFAKEEGLGIKLNEMVEDYPFYGSLVLHKRGKKYEVLDLNKLRNQQDAKDLNTASYVIIEHTMKMWEAQAMPDWDLSGIKCGWDEDITVFERYGRVPARFFDATADESESVDTVSFVCLDKKGKKPDSQLLFIEQIENRGFKECHWKKRKGRWMGVGVIEDNFENQKSRNAVFNMRMRSALWSSKKIYQSSDEGVGKNLVSEVRDGDVMYVTAGGQITPVNVQTQGNVDFNSTDETIDKNSDQKSFTYEVTTGEQLQSGTPFRLGMIMSEAANTYFAFKREKLVLMLKEWIYDEVFDDFYKSISKESIEALYQGEDDYDELVTVYTNSKIKEFRKAVVLSELRVPTPEEEEIFIQTISKMKGFEIKVIKDELKDAKFKIDIIVDGESVDVNKKMETYTNLYQSYLQMGNVASANAMLGKIAKLTGDKLPKTLQSMPSMPTAQTAESAIQ
jgi:hypothetical protein